MRYILILLLLTSCSLSEVLETPMPRTKSDTTYIPRQLDTTETSDIPIGFEVTIEDWEDTEIDINL
jgi:hypothetical protein